MSNVDEIERLAQLFADNQLINDQAQTDIDFEYGTQLNESVGSSEKVIDESFDDLNRRTLRSGNHYSTSPKYTKAVTPVTGDSVSVAKSVTTLLTQPSVKSKNTNLLNTNTKMASSKPHTSTTTTPKADNVINIMQRGDYVRNFTGQDDYRVAHFIRACEDSMRNSHITTDEEKKAYVRSHITQGSYAGSRLNAFGLQSPDYEKFKRTLIGIFGGRSQLGQLQWIFRWLDRCIPGIRNETPVDAVDIAGEVRQDMQATFRSSGWYNSQGDMPPENVEILIELISFLLSVRVPLYSRAQEVQYEPPLDMVEYANKLCPQATGPLLAQPSVTSPQPQPYQTATDASPPDSLCDTLSSDRSSPPNI